MLEVSYERPFRDWEEVIEEAEIIGLWDRGY
jgi:hypothetical protein